MSLRKLLQFKDSHLIRDVIKHFLLKQENLEEDYSIEELETFFKEDYSKGCQSNKDTVALWNFEKVITDFKEAA